LAEAQEMAESMVSSLQKGGSVPEVVLKLSLPNLQSIFFLPAFIFCNFENGKYSDLPHILSFMNRSYKEIFDTLFTNEEIFLCFHLSKQRMITKLLTSWKDKSEH
jgi:hypothetical protein